LSVPVFSQTNGVNAIVLKSLDAAFDSVSRRLFLYDGANIWGIDIDGPEIFGPTSFGAAAGNAQLAAAEDGQTLYAAFDNGALVRLDERSLRVITNRTVHVPRVTYDVKVSPTDPALVAISLGQGTFLYRNGTSLSPGSGGYGTIAFSADGTRLYLANQADCTLDILQVSDSGLLPLAVKTNASCSSFELANGLLYFDSGLIYDPAKGEKASQVRISSVPSLVAPDSNGTINLLTRSNGFWVINRLSGDNLQITNGLTLGALTPSPFDLMALDPNDLAVRTSDTFLLINAASRQVRLQTVLQSRNVVLRFTSIPGMHYRLERTESLSPAQWSTVTDLNDSSGAIQFTVTPNTTNDFFRVITLP
jgi:hypothetical protein